MTDKLVTYQLTIQGGSDVVLRLLPSDVSIIEPVERVKDVLDLVEDRVEVKVYEEDPTGHSKSRELTPDEAEALEDALERVLGSKVKVQPTRQGDARPRPKARLELVRRGRCRPQRGRQANPEVALGLCEAQGGGGRAERDSRTAAPRLLHRAREANRPRLPRRRVVAGGPGQPATAHLRVLQAQRLKGRRVAWPGAPAAAHAGDAQPPLRVARRAALGPQRPLRAHGPAPRPGRCREVEPTRAQRRRRRHAPVRQSGQAGADAERGARTSFAASSSTSPRTGFTPPTT